MNTRVLAAMLCFVPPAGAGEPSWELARANGVQVNEIFERTSRMMRAWLAHADPRTLLLPDRLGGPAALYTPHNSGADHYPYLVITAFFTDPGLYRGRMVEMLRNEVRYTTAGGRIPGSLDLRTGARGPASLFGAGEYAKDGLLSITELLGRTPWYYRMVDLMEEFRERAPVRTRFGNLPDAGAELNGDVLQTLVRLIPMTGDQRLLGWAEQIGDAYVEEILPRNHFLPGFQYDFEKRADTGSTRLRDHGNEIVVGLAMLLALETEMGRPRAAAYLPAVRKMLDRVLASANRDGMLYDEIRNADLQPVKQRLSDGWGYVYSAVYAFYQATGESRYRDAVLRVLRNLPKYRNQDWENGSMDGYADAIEGALYLVNREPVPEALDWIESEMRRLIAYQQPDGTIERWYGDGNWNRTLLLYAMMKTQGCYLRDWHPGVELGAVRDGAGVRVTVHAAAGWRGRICFDFARHRRVMQYGRNYARLNEWPEWFPVDENTLYDVREAGAGSGRVLLGSELKAGVDAAVPAGGTLRLTIRPLEDRQ